MRYRGDDPRRVRKAIRRNRDRERLITSPWRAYLDTQAGFTSGSLDRIADWPITPDPAVFRDAPMTLTALARWRGTSVMEAALYLQDLENVGLCRWDGQRQIGYFQQPSESVYD